MNTQTQTARQFPYVGASGWLTKLHQLCVRSMPQRVEVDWLMATDRLGLKQPNARQLVSLMEKVGWVQEDGTVTDEGKNLRLVGDAWQGAMKETAERLYHDLLEQIESAAEFSPQDVEEFFIAATDMGQSGRQQMIAVFRWFLRQAALTEVEQKVWPGTRRTSRGTRQARQEEPRAGEPKVREPTKAKAKPLARQEIPSQQDSLAADARLSAIASVLKISIDGTWEEGRIQAAFRMLDRLLKGEPIDG